jgi:LmbE family N-acetylglucosaminyl deacetylase|nr:MAG TPA: LMBE-RELATED PROTEIN, DEACETYLASE, ROSSMANN FOLD, ZINC-DEPENDENT.8A [Caudoviricetes sp.]
MKLGPSRTYLVLSPHADDSELGMGATIAKLCSRGNRVVVALIANHDEYRVRQFREACRILGSEPLVMSEHGYSFDDGYVGNDMVKLVTSIDSLKNEIKPGTIFLPYPSVHQDHCSVYEAGVRSARISLDDSQYFIPNVLAYREPVSQLDIYNTGLTFNVFQKLKAKFVDLKMQAIEAHKTEVLPYPHPSSAKHADEYSKTIGSLCGSRRAEEFAVIRMRKL